jgi:hypothetical protein
MAISVIHANDPLSLASGSLLENVKDVKNYMSPKQDEETSPSNTTSAETVPPKYDLVTQQHVAELLNMKCTSCNMVTQHEWTTIEPRPRFNVTNPIEEVISNYRKIIMCTQCAKLSLKT